MNRTIALWNLLSVPRRTTWRQKNTLRKDNGIIVREQAIAKFWTELARTLSYSKKRSQCYQNKYFKECYRRYYSFVQQSFSEEENRAFDYGPSYDKDLIDKICERNKCDYSTALRRLYTVEEYMKQGILSRELLYKIMTDRINNY